MTTNTQKDGRRERSARQESAKEKGKDAPKGKDIPEGKSSDELLENILAIAIVLIVCALVGWWLYARATAPLQQQAQDSERVDVHVGTSPILGNDSASITIVEFSDYECSFCGQFEHGTFPQVKKEYVDTGKVRIVFKHFPLKIHPHSMDAAQAAVCAQEQGKFWEYHDTLFAHQDALTTDDLKRYAQELGLDTTRFNECLGNRQEEVQRDIQAGERAGVTGTPTFFIDGKKVVGALSFEDFRREIDK